MIDLICLKIVSNCYRLIKLPIVESLSANSTVLCCFVSLNVHFTVSLMFDFFLNLFGFAFSIVGVSFVSVIPLKQEILDLKLKMAAWMFVHSN